MNLREYLRNASEHIPAAPHANPRLETEVLIRHALRISREQFFADLERTLTSDEAAAMDALVARRASGEPLAYITGHREFYGLDFVVNNHVLIPRQETELLVDLALDFAKDWAPNELSIADVGTGSGAIAIALAINLPGATVFATEWDDGAIEVARANCRRHDVQGRVDLLEGDLLEPIQGQVDIIVSNPPYIPTDEIEGLAVEVQQEPRQALDGGLDGLDTFRRLIGQAPTKLKPRGLMLVELSPQQMDNAEILAAQAFPLTEVSHADDLLGLARVLVIKCK